MVIGYLCGMDLMCWGAANLPHFVLEQNAEFKLPPTAHVVKIATSNGSSWCEMAVYFEMRSDDLDSFVKATRVGSLSSTQQVTWSDSYREKRVQNLGFDQPSVKSYLFGYTDADYFNKQSVFVDTSDPQRYTVYLVTERGYLD
jgi:hypothetical protein